MLINDFTEADKILPVEILPNSDQAIADSSRKICVEIAALEVAPADDFPCYDFTFLDEIIPSIALHPTNVLCCFVKNDRAKIAEELPIGVFVPGADKVYELFIIHAWLPSSQFKLLLCFSFDAILALF
jgi:hypothetical protein